MTKHKFCYIYTHTHTHNGRAMTSFLCVCGNNLATCTQAEVTQESVRHHWVGKREWARERERERVIESALCLPLPQLFFLLAFCLFCGARLFHFHCVTFVLRFCSFTPLLFYFLFFFWFLLSFKLIKSVWQNNKRWPCFCAHTHPLVKLFVSVC